MTRVDQTVWVRCTNPECAEGKDPLDSSTWWNPEVEIEYLDEYAMSGTAFYTDDAFTCRSCGQEGEEVNP